MAENTRVGPFIANKPAALQPYESRRIPLRFLSSSIGVFSRDIRLSYYHPYQTGTKIALFKVHTSACPLRLLV